MLYHLSKIKDVVLDVLFPAVCLNCQKYIGNGNQLICKECLVQIKLNTSLFCPFCRTRMADNKKICRHSKKDFPYSYFLAPAGNYDDPTLQNLIHYFKYQKFEKLAPILGEIILKYLNQLPLLKAKQTSPQRGSATKRAWFFREAKKSEGAAPAKPLAGRLSDSENSSAWLVIPIPLHFWREKTRGFNQSKLLAEYIAKNLNLPIIEGLKRIKNNKPQAKSKNSEERNKNVEGIFKITNPESIRGKNIILIDDVFTSGATINEAIKILKQNSANKIIALVIAKA